ncbi:MAG TPA: GNVR domain-containing protein [Bryobacteraceae bacterium]|jgi:succinoglycan biosynthesis transport protein ExoP|nr:GNVR domain-containing protein [Bryobacteraceae bacterium]
MQPTEGYSVPRRALDVEDYIDIVRRHKGWIFGPFLFCAVASVVGVYMWPDTYVSQAVVKVTPQQVPESMVQSSVNQQMFDRINSMEQVILSRGTLTTIINNLGLYTRERTRVPIEDVIEEMRKNIQVVPVSNPNRDSRTIPAFAVQFKYDDKYKAQRVVSDLVGRFIEENQRNRSNQTYQTTVFMKDQLDAAKKDLDAVENKLTTFRMANNGRLPDQAQSNMNALQALNVQLTSLDSAISRANQERLQIEARRQIYKDQLVELNKQPPPEAASLAQKNEKLVEADRDITLLEDTLRNLRQKYSDNFPDVQTVQGRLQAAKQKRDDIAKEDASKKPEKSATPRPENPQLTREKRDLDGAIRQLDSAIEAKDLEIQNYNKEVKRTSDSIKIYQTRIETVPLGEKEYSELMRDREIARANYVELEQKLEKAQVSEQMEVRKQGELLELLDPASLPGTPTEPKRPMIISIGCGLGLLLGMVVAGAREMKDTSLKNLKDVRAYTQMAILGSVPLLENDFVVRRRKRLAWLGWTTACLAAVVIMAGSVVYYYTSKV